RICWIIALHSYKLDGKLGYIVSILILILIFMLRFIVWCHDYKNDSALMSLGFLGILSQVDKILRIMESGGEHSIYNMRSYKG
ncbi:MAG TPA: hypothetical protein PLU95_10410, partial [Syntrophales bacterium]|nr:hypothetical protein [Syntrophorhabdaceae bacterium]HPL66217.1 hypothetical protein [Smithellaceae bacterium]HPN09705.1 hypothetical protein [Syntrophales bacterium]